MDVVPDRSALDADTVRDADRRLLALSGELGCVNVMCPCRLMLTLTPRTCLKPLASTSPTSTFRYVHKKGFPGRAYVIYLCGWIASRACKLVIYTSYLPLCSDACCFPIFALLTRLQNRPRRPARPSTSVGRPGGLRPPAVPRCAREAAAVAVCAVNSEANPPVPHAAAAAAGPRETRAIRAPAHMRPGADRHVELAHSALRQSRPHRSDPCRHAKGGRENAHRLSAPVTRQTPDWPSCGIALAPSA